MLQQLPPERTEEHASLAQLTIQATYGAMAVSEQAVMAALDALSFVRTPGACTVPVGVVILPASSVCARQGVYCAGGCGHVP